MMPVRTALLAFVALLLAHIAEAAPTTDPEAWSKAFVEAAMTNDAAKLTEVITAVANPRLPKERIAESIKGVIDHFADKKPALGERFEVHKLGSFLLRYRFAFAYPEQYLFYGIDLVRSADGWELSNLKVSTNLNELMTDPYPFK